MTDALTNVESTNHKPTIMKLFTLSSTRRVVCATFISSTLALSSSSTLSAEETKTPVEQPEMVDEKLGMLEGSGALLALITGFRGLEFTQKS